MLSPCRHAHTFLHIPFTTWPPCLLTPSLQVFSIGEEVKETNDSGFLGTVPTLHTQLLADGSLLQVCARVCFCKLCAAGFTCAHSQARLSAPR